LLQVKINGQPEIVALLVFVQDAVEPFLGRIAALLTAEVLLELQLDVGRAVDLGGVVADQRSGREFWIRALVGAIL
jgi:hypothetical protein